MGVSLPRDIVHKGPCAVVRNVATDAAKKVLRPGQEPRYGDPLYAI